MASPVGGSLPDADMGSPPSMVLAQLDGSSFLNASAAETSIVDTPPPPGSTSVMAALDSVLARNDAFLHRRKAKIEAQIEANETSFRQEATFRPRTNHGDSRVDPTAASERLFRDAAERKVRNLSPATDRKPSSRSAPIKGGDAAAPAQHHVASLLDWEAQRKERLDDASRQRELSELQELRSAPSIDPVSRALAASLVRTDAPKRRPHAQSPALSAPAAHALTPMRTDQMVERLYYGDNEVRRLEQQLAKVRVAKAQSTGPQLCRKSLSLAGATVPSDVPVHERLLREGSRVEDRRSARAKAEMEERRRTADVGQYIGSVSHVVGTVARARRCRTPPVSSPKPELVPRSFSPTINKRSKELDAKRSGGDASTSGPTRVQRLHEESRRLAEERERSRLSKLNDENEEVQRRAREGAKLMKAAGHGPGDRRTSDAAASTPRKGEFLNRLDQWCQSRTNAAERRHREEHARREAEEQAACTFKPVTNHRR